MAGQKIRLGTHSTDDERNSSERMSYLIPLSAKTSDALHRKIRDLDHWLEGEGAEHSIGNIAYTLLVGRSHFSVRHAFLASDLSDLRQKVKAIAQNGLAEHAGREESNKTRKLDPALKEFGNRLIEELQSSNRLEEEMRNKRLRVLADLYSKGYELNWRNLYDGANFHRISLPAYPFAKETHRISESAQLHPLQEKRDRLHPLLDCNESTLREEKFKKVLLADEFFVHDHVVAGSAILPGVCYLEMAREAGELAAEQTVRIIKDVIWARPILVSGMSKEIAISLHPEAGGVAFEVSSNEEGTRVVHSRGKIQHAETNTVLLDSYDLNAIKQRCTHSTSKHDYYKAYRDVGIDYGPSFQVTEEALTSEGEALLHLRLPNQLQDGFAQYGLHPSLLDGAFRAALAAGDAHGRLDVLRVPFALGQLEIMRPLESECYAYAHLTSSNRGDQGGAIVCDVVILNGQGEVLVRVKDLTVRPFKAQTETDNKQSHMQDAIYYRKVWRDVPKHEDHEANHPNVPSVVVFTENEALVKTLGLCVEEVVFVKPGQAYLAETSHRYTINPSAPEEYKRLLSDLQSQGICTTHVIHAWNAEQDIKLLDDIVQSDLATQLESSLSKGIYSILYLLQAVTQMRNDSKYRCLFVYPRSDRGGVPCHETVAGFANSLTTVNHKFELVSLQIEEPLDGDSIAKLLVAEMESKDNMNGTEIRYETGKRQKRVIEPLEESALAGTGAAIKTGGVYLITGGAGGLGMIFARHLAERYQARLILTGRSVHSEHIENKLQELRSLGAQGTMYCRADVAKLQEMQDVVQAARDSFQQIDGVLHAAGIIGTIPALEADRAAFEQVLLPKIQGTIHLDVATVEEPLDFFVLFSSISAVVGDFGWGSYAAGNRFLDGYAGYREQLRADGKRNGKSISFNWPLWSGGAMELPEHEAALYLAYSGMQAMKPESGLRVFEAAVNANLSELIVMSGDPHKINRVLKIAQDSRTKANRSGRSPLGKSPDVVRGEQKEETLLQAAENYLKNLLSKATAIPSERIDSQVELEAYGIDSIMIMELNRLLEADFEELSMTLFFEYGNLHDMAGYFAKHQAERIAVLTGLHEQKQADEQQSVELDRQRARFLEAGVLDGSSARSGEANDEIAIIGVAGRFPMAENVEQFWDNLRRGRDCITEIPLERWDYHHSFESGKVYSKWGGFIEDVDKFDPLFFNISPREAELMDPQERLFLETSWQAIEDAGYTKQRLAKRKVGVFVGAMFSQYQLFGVEETMKGNPVATGSFFSSIANRVSYFLNLSGPSLAVDTACSSALEAVRLACQNIMSGACEMAIAGGVNTTLHPNKYLYLSQQRFLSKDGKCRSFGADGSGYVPGEGVGSVILKPLRKAVEDGDLIYAVIKGLSVNHGGKTNGYTVPNPNAQADLILDTFRQANVDARTVNCIEAHGTGTSLGDPIEITGLTKAFREYTEDTQFCSIGSVKSNIGHLESAAGIASIIKVILQMKHKQLAPSLHSQKLNPSIRFADSPFYVQQELNEWKKPVIVENGKATEYPRRAGISGFGAGGTNVHVLLEEFTPTPDAMAGAEGSVLVVLSARNEDRLQARAKQLLDMLQREQNQVRLCDIAYTLQVGREPMESRLALHVQDSEELLQKLKAWIGGDRTLAGAYQGNTEHDENVSHQKRSDDGAMESAKAALVRRDLATIARLWVAGTELEWEGLYSGSTPKRVSLPGYPFARDRYWLPVQPGEVGLATKLHPLIDVNVSTFEEQVYKKTLQADEFFVKDHVVSGQHILPGVAYLEMARAAGERAAKRQVRAIRDVIWAKPIVVEAGTKELYIGLYPGQTSVEYDVYGFENEQRVVYSQGKILFDQTELPHARTYRIDEIKNRCTVRRGKAEIETRFASMGFDYGPAFQVCQEAFINHREALVKLTLPAVVKPDAVAFGLHPSLMDGVLRSIALIGWEEQNEHLELRIPFSMGDMQFMQPLPHTCYVYAMISSDNRGRDEDLIQYDISVLNDAGEELVKISDFIARRFVRQDQAAELLYYHPVWKVTPLSSMQAGSYREDQVLLVFDHGEERMKRLQQHIRDVILVTPGSDYQMIGRGRYVLNPTRPEHYKRLIADLHRAEVRPLGLLHLWSLDALALDYETLSSEHAVHLPLAYGLNTGLYSMVHLFQAVTEHMPDLRIRCLYVLQGGEEQISPLQEALSGFANALTTVNHRFELLTFQCDANHMDAEALSALLLQELAEMSNTNGMEICYQSGTRLVRTLQPLAEGADADSQEVEELLKPNGVYLLTGGAGGLGMIFARYLATCYQANIVLMGRSPQDESIDTKLQELRHLGAIEAIYLQADVSQLADVRHAVQATKARFGVLNGIFHSAGIAGRVPVTELDRSGFEKVILPKVHGTLNLDMATRDDELDVFVLFSSVAALVGDFGAGNYSFANRFLDRYAALREQLRRVGKRSGRTISINWPLWSEGGLALPEDEAVMYFEYSGLRALDTASGIRAFEKALQTRLPQVVVVNGDKQKISKVLKQSATDANHVQEVRATKQNHTRGNSQLTGSEESLLKETENYLKDLLSQTIKLPAHSIDARTALEKYGIDSIMIMELNKLLEQDFHSLPKTLFFEYKNLNELAHYFLDRHADRMADILGLVSEHESKQAHALAGISSGFQEVAVSLEAKQSFRRATSRSTQGEQPLVQESAPDEDIAIIGVSGRYPQARNLAEFWGNLKNGLDCITEIPPQRWNADEYYDPDLNQEGKSSSKWGGFLDGVDQFDPLFFNISPRDAELMDPQERLFLETVWHTIEDAGYPKKALDDRNVGVFVGVMYGHYQLFGVEEGRKGHHVYPSSSYASIANRVSYFFNFHGPSIAVDTMCSSSLTAIHLACESLRRGESEMAIAGGVNVSVHPNKYIQLSQMHFPSSDGRCRSFGAGGDGYVPGEGVGALLLKPLNKALHDGDLVYAVIKSTTINHGGKTNGFTVPNPAAQGHLIAEALKKAKVEAQSISYLEAHGTGTELGDPIEVAGLMRAFGENTQDKQYCSIGSVKSNIGHLESAAGIAAVTKVLLQMKHKMLVPSLHAEQLNPNIDFEQTPFYVQRELTNWQPPLIKKNGVEHVYPRRAGISGFGAGGTNVHIIMEEYETPVRTPRVVSEEPTVFVLSAKNETRLRHYASELAEFLKQVADTPLTAPTEPMNRSELFTKIASSLRQMASQILQVAEHAIDWQEDLSEYGFDAMALSAWADRLNATFDLEVDADIFREHNSIELLTGHLIETFKNRFQAHYGHGFEVEAFPRGGSFLSTTDVAYTLQTGREPMEERLALVGSNLHELADQLAAFSRRESNIENLYHGNVNDSSYKNELFFEEEGQEFITKLTRNKKLTALARLWVAGAEIDWELMYPHGTPQRISLPKYPFARERYWVTDGGKSARSLLPEYVSIAKLHPLLDANDSTVEELCFLKAWNRDEFFIRDAPEKTRALFPGLVHVEMARAAGELIWKQRRVRTLRDVTWAKPVTLQKDEVQAAINLYRNGEALDFEIGSTSAGDQREIHCQGSIEYASEADVAGDVLDLNSIKQRCVDRKTGQEFYRAGHYGPTLQPVQELSHGATEALASMELPEECPKEQAASFMMHPSLLEGALQTASFLTGQTGRFAPNALRELDLFEPLPAKLFVWVTLTRGDYEGGNWTFEVQFVAPNGRVLVCMKDFSIKSSGELPDTPLQDRELLEMLYKLEHGEMDVDEVDHLTEEILHGESPPE